jgi:aerobic-type carbon monoxide dehydrogenase small subunit (CoxS/CutS family)
MARLRTIALMVNGEPLSVDEGTSVAAALALRAVATRRSATGTPRHAYCGMGVCGECRVSIDGQPLRLGCMVLCRDGMRVAHDVL